MATRFHPSILSFDQDLTDPAGEITDDIERCVGDWRTQSHVAAPAPAPVRIELGIYADPNQVGEDFNTAEVLDSLVSGLPAAIEARPALAGGQIELTIADNAPEPLNEDERDFIDGNVGAAAIIYILTIG